MTRTLSVLCGFSLALALVAGCSSERPKGQVSGTVKFNGKLVPEGTITFMPDSAKGNKGPATLAVIKDGKYDTAQEQKSGVFAGEYMVVIAGFDGKPTTGFPQGKPIFNPHTINDNFPAGNSQKDFDVPLAAAADLKILPNAPDPDK
jgi:hypothetical protein